MLAFLRKNQILLANGLCVLLSLYILTAAARGHLKQDPVGPVLLWFMRPLQIGAEATSDSIKNLQQVYWAMTDFKAENQRLKRRIQELEIEKNRLLEAEATNRRLKDLLAFVFCHAGERRWCQKRNGRRHSFGHCRTGGLSRPSYREGVTGRRSEQRGGRARATHPGPRHRLRLRGIRHDHEIRKAQRRYSRRRSADHFRPGRHFPERFNGRYCNKSPQTESGPFSVGRSRACSCVFPHRGSFDRAS